MSVMKSRKVLSGLPLHALDFLMELDAKAMQQGAASRQPTGGDAAGEAVYW
jgi:hypothetical protein